MPAPRAQAAAEGMPARPATAYDALFNLEQVVRDADLFGQVAGHMVEDIIRPNGPDRSTVLTEREAERLAFIVYRANEAVAAVLAAWEAASAKAAEARR